MSVPGGVMGGVLDVGAWMGRRQNMDVSNTGGMQGCGVEQYR